jgi:membrane associated rhomboid family serine protease
VFLFLPLGTTRPRWREPYVTYALIGLNVFVYFIEIAYPDALPAGLVPSHPTFAGLFAAAFMHASLLHLAGNMLFLWLFATLTEDVFGHWMLLGFYLAGHLGASLLHAAASALVPGESDVPLIGASGAIAGIMGLSAVCFFRTRVRVWYFYWLLVYWRMDVAEIAAPVFLGLWVGWEFLQGALFTWLKAPSDSAHWAHVGGFAVGVVGALALGLRHRVVKTDLAERHQTSATRFEAYSQMTELEGIVKATPDDPEAWYALARARVLAGRPDNAAAAYERALEIFLRQRRDADAVRAYEGVRDHGGLDLIPRHLHFPLACALAGSQNREDALRFFVEIIEAGPKGPQTETALLRAGDIAAALPGRSWQARQIYQKLLEDYPYGPWRHIALDRLKHLQQAPAAGPIPTDTSPSPGASPGLRPLGSADDSEAPT